MDMNKLAENLIVWRDKKERSLLKMGATPAEAERLSFKATLDKLMKEVKKAKKRGEKLEGDVTLD